jgi:hypothetical protein
VPRSFLHDGFDDSSYTASSLDLSGTDKVTVWAGVFKNADGSTALLAEFTANSGTTAGAFAVFGQVGTNSIRFRSGGSPAGTFGDADGSVPAPASRVVSGIGDIAGDISTLRLNGVQAGTSANDQGTGNYANAILNIGRRNNTSAPFNGKIYTIIIRGGVTDAATLALTERYVGSRMGIVL